MSLVDAFLITSAVTAALAATYLGLYVWKHKRRCTIACAANDRFILAHAVTRLAS